MFSHLVDEVCDNSRDLKTSRFIISLPNDEFILIVY